MAWIEALAPVLAALGIAGSYLILRGFWEHRGRDDLSPTYRLSAGVMLIVTAYLARSLYWEFAPLILSGASSPDAWTEWFALTGTAINVAFSAVFLRGLYHLLVLLWLLIDEDKRSDWSLLEAPWYPDRAAFARAVQALRHRWRSREKGDDNV